MTDSRLHLYRYSDGQCIGTARPDVWPAYWDLMQQRPEGLISLGDLPRDSYDLDEYYQGTHPSVTVYI